MRNSEILSVKLSYSDFSRIKFMILFKITQWHFFKLKRYEFSQFRPGNLIKLIELINFRSYYIYFTQI